MKIAILASGSGEKALHLYDFFKEGNRVEVTTILTDDPAAEVAVRFAAEGIPVEVVAGMDDPALGDMVEALRRNEVELLVVDGYPEEVPPPLAEAFGEAIVYPSGVREAPLEIIETVDRLKRSESRDEEPEKDMADQQSTTNNQQSTVDDQPTLEDEWAKALNVNPPSLPEDPGQASSANGQPSTPPPAPGQPPTVQGQPSTPPPVQGQPSLHSGKMPDTYLVWSVLATILCCLIPGIVAIVYSSSVSSKFYAGDVEGARRASRNAQIWVIVSVVVGIIWGTLYFPLTLMLG